MAKVKSIINIILLDTPAPEPISSLPSHIGALRRITLLALASIGLVLGIATTVHAEAPIDPATAVKIYESLIGEQHVDAILGPYATNITEAVAEVSEKHRKPMLAPNAATSRQGR